MKKKIPYDFILTAVSTFIYLIYPFLLKGCSYLTGLSNQPWFFETEPHQDFYLLFRSYALNLLGIALLTAIFIYLLRKDTHFQWSRRISILLYSSIAVYLIGVIGSTILSSDPVISLRGGLAQFESVFTLLTYLCLMYFYMLYAKGRAELFQTVLKTCLCITSVILIILGLIQYFNAGEEVYLTFYNPNYASVYLLLVIPLMLYFTIDSFFVVGQKPVTWFYELITLGLMFCLFLTKSKWNICVFLIQLYLLLLIFLRRWKGFKALLGLSCGMLLLLTVITISRFCADSRTCVDPTGASNLQEFYTGRLSRLSTNQEDVTLYYDEEMLSFSSDPGTSSRELDYRPASFKMHDDTVYNGFAINTGYETQYFTNETSDGTYRFITPYGTLMKLAPADAVLFENTPSLLSGRGYIWARTLPLLKDCCVFGFGPDTFILHFPHNDYFAALSSNNLYHLITKPHCLYLQIATQTGIPSMSAFLLLCGLYMVLVLQKWIRQCMHKKKSSSKRDLLPDFSFFIFLSVFGYLAAGLLHDSCVAVAPVFWCLLGVGYSRLITEL